MFDLLNKLLKKRFKTTVFLIFIATSVIARLPTFFFDFFSNDEAAHITGSYIVSNGYTLYRDFVDNKPPFIYWFYLVAQYILGEDIKSVHIATTLILIPLTALFIALIFKNRENGHRLGIVSGILYIIFTSAYIPTDMLATNCEIIMIFFAAIGFYFLIGGSKKGHFLFGIFLGLSIFSKQQSAIWIFIPATALILNKSHFKDTLFKLFIFIIGFLIPLLIIMSLIDAKDEFFQWVILHNIGYSRNPIGIYEVTKRIIKYLLPYALIISPLIYSVIKGFLRVERDILHIYFPALILSIIPVFTGFRFFPHYFIQMVYPLIPLSVFYFKDINNTQKKLRMIILYCLLLTMSFNIYTFAFYSKKTPFIEETEPAFYKIPDYIKSLKLCPDEKRKDIFIYGYAPLFYYYFYIKCNMLPASRFVLPQASITGYIPGNESALEPGFDASPFINKKDRDLLISDLSKNNPLIIIDTSPSGFHHWDRYPLIRFEDLNNFIAKKYRVLKEINGFIIYVRK